VKLHHPHCNTGGRLAGGELGLALAGILMTSLRKD